MITDILYALKRTAMGTGLYPDQFPVYQLSKSFVHLVNRYGRNPEILLLLSYYLRRNPLALFRLIPLGIRMWMKGRTSLFPAKIKGIRTIRHILEASKGLELPLEKEEGPYSEDVVGYKAVG